jgi:hypothetical protein
VTTIRKMKLQYDALCALQRLIYDAKCLKRIWDEAGCKNAFSEEMFNTHLRDAMKAISEAEVLALRYGLWEEGVVG